MRILINIFIKYFGISISINATSVKEKPLSEQAEKKVLVGNFSLFANESHLIEQLLSIHPYYSRNLARIANYVTEAYPETIIIDIGANIGDSIALIRSAQCNSFIYAIEGDKSYFRLLQKNVSQFFTNLSVHNNFLGEFSKSIQSDLVALGGTLNIQHNPASANTLDVITLDDFVAENKIQNLKLIKIDTDGFDLMILRGGLKCIDTQKPVLFFEYDEKYLKQNNEDGLQTLLKLKDLGYEKAIYYDNFGRYLLSTNLNNINTLKELYLYISGSRGAFPYFDLCLFHKSDNALAGTIISKELEYFQNN
jgi:FkbM family methyltransferase